MIINKESKYKPFQTPNIKLLDDPDIQKYLKDIKNKIPKSLLNTKKYTDLINHFDLNLYQTDYYCGGYYSQERKEIRVNLKYSETHNEIRKVLAHELSHHVQDKIGILDKYHNDDLLSSALKLEQQAETMSYLMWDILFPGIAKNPKIMQSYFKETDFKYLYNHYSKYYENDLFIIK